MSNNNNTESRPSKSRPRPAPRSVYMSQDSLGRYNEVGLHDGLVNDRDKLYKGACWTRIPYATLIATVLCLTGVGIFCSTLYRGASLSVTMFDQVFHFRAAWMEVIQLTFTAIGACMGAIGLIMLVIGFFATGATRHQVYRRGRVQVGGKISSTIFLVLTYILHIAWVLMLSFLILITITNAIFWKMCQSRRVTVEQSCIDFTQFDFLFPSTIRPDDLKICGIQEIKLFCKDFVETAQPMFILASCGCFIVVISLVHYLTCLAANYAHIVGQKKFKVLEELTHIKLSNQK